jgi:micrococcal nuclease
MATRVVLALCLIASVIAFAPPATSAQDVTCAGFDAWVWAQTVHDADPAAYQAALDPDGNGIACEQLPVVGGFAPVLWTDAIPAGAEAVQVTSITDGDTFAIVGANGQPDTVRMYHIDTPETSNLGGGPHCGGDAATAFLSTVLSYAPGGTVYLEYDVTQRDRFHRRLAYVWYELGGDVYLVNEVMVRNGFAESETFEPDVKYREQLNAAEQWSVEKVTGVRLECGRFGQPIGSQPSNEQTAQA